VTAYAWSVQNGTTSVSQIARKDLRIVYNVSSVDFMAMTVDTATTSINTDMVYTIL
jgi:hypothetical protein